MKIAYIRPSDGHPASEQEAALRAAGAERIYREEVVTPRKPLAMLTEAARSLRQGDTLLVTRLDRLGRTKREALTVIAKAHSLGASVALLAEGIETTADALAFGQALAEADRAWGAERGAAGVDAARQVKTRKGRPRAIEPDMLPLARTLWLSGRGTAKEAAAQVGVDVATMYRLFGPRTARND
jgi:DNA invertase Pin-like site-specific DNA recombinase